VYVALTSHGERRLQGAVTDLNNAISDAANLLLSIVDLPRPSEGLLASPAAVHRLHHILQMFTVDHVAGWSSTLLVGRA